MRMGQLVSNKASTRVSARRYSQSNASRRATRVSAAPPPTRLRQYTGSGVRLRDCTCQHIELRPDFSDLWRLKDVVDILEEGATVCTRIDSPEVVQCQGDTLWCCCQIGVVPTDSYPALICDLQNANAAELLAAVKDISPTKPMSILVKDFATIDEYTNGWPAPGEPGMPDWFKVVKQVLPGPYTFILPASKSMPKLKMTDGKVKKKTKQRSSVGVRIPDHPVCQEILNLLGRPLLCTSCSAHVEDGIESFSAALLMDTYPDIDFVVDCGFEDAAPSTVIDMTAGIPVIVREGRGDVSLFES